MSRKFLDLDRSVVVLCGTWQHIHDSDFSEGQEVQRRIERSLTRLEALFRDEDYVGVPRVKTIFNVPRGQFLKDLRRFCGEAQDTLVFYYIGHGQVGRDRTLYFDAADAVWEDIDATGVDFVKVRDCLLASPATRKVYVFDSCYSGRTHNKEGVRIGELGDDDVSGLRLTLDQIQGVYSIASAPPDKTALADEGEYTTFSGTIIRVMQEGIPTDYDTITVDELYGEVWQRLVQQGKPEPERKEFRNIGDLGIARNRGRVWRPPCWVISPATSPSTEQDTITSCKQLLKDVCTDAHYATRLVQVRDRTTEDARFLAELDSVPLATFYLREDANCQSMHFLIGYRYRTGLPTLCFAHENETITDGFPVPVVPLPNLRCISATLCDEPKREKLVAALSEAVEKAVDEYRITRWKSSLPVATIRMDLGDGPHRLTEISPAAAKLFHFGKEEISSVTLDQVMGRLEPLTRPPQRRPFSDEQTLLIGRLINDRKHVYATKPIWLQEYDELDPSVKRIANREVMGRAFLPVIVQYSFGRESLMLLVLYVDVTKYIIVDAGVASCDLFARLAAIQQLVA
jgi:hypothetical protein